MDEEIKRVEQRLAELQPALDEADQLRAVLDNLIKLKRAPDPATLAQDEGKRPYLRREERIEQIRRHRAHQPHATNKDIAKALNVTPARVSQLLSEIDDETA